MSWNKKSPQRQLAYMKEYYKNNREKMRAYQKKYREQDPEKFLRQMRESYHRRRDKINAARREFRKKNPEHFVKLRYMRLYGIPPEEFKLLYDAQSGCCAICKQPGKLVVDHDHETGVVRSLLCSPCNTSLGLLKEDLSRLQAMREYILARCMK